MRRVIAVLSALLTALAVLTVVPSAGGTEATATVSPVLAEQLARPETDSVGAFASFTPGGHAAGVAAATETGVTVVREYPLVDAAFVVGTVAEVKALAQRSEVVYLDGDRPVSLMDETAGWATGVEIARRNVGAGPYTVGGQVLDGAGIGVAVVDSGVDASHPDLIDRVARNFKGVCTTPFLINTETETCYGSTLVEEVSQGGAPQVEFQELPPGSNSDTTSGHGTHVAGTVAGTGVASKGAYAGAAPGATLYGFGVGEGLHILMAVESFNFILENYDTFVPRIRVVTNSWGDFGSPYDANSVTARMTRALVAKGANVLFAAGNGDATNWGGDGTADFTSSTCDDPTPGVICVANYDDQNTGTRDFELDSSSSRGLSTDATTWPDLAAPGSSIVSACATGTALCALGTTTKWAPEYATMGGTSMATPHVAGAVALLWQARPDLTPAAVEDVLQDTAHKFTAGAAYASDPQNADGTSSFDKGAGLLQIVAALDSLGVAHGHTATPFPLTLATDGGGDAQPSADILEVTVDQTADGLRYTVTLADTSAPLGSTIRLFQKIDGVAYTTNVAYDAAGASAGTAIPTTAVAVNVSKVGNTISFDLPFASLGNPGPSTPIYTVQVASYTTLIQDVAPGGTGLSINTAPEFVTFETAPAATTTTRKGGGKGSVKTR